MASHLPLVKELLAGKKYAALEARLAETPVKELARLVPALPAMDRLIVFKLLDASRAMEVFGELSFEDKYLVFCAFPLQAVAPALEGLSPAELRPFVQLPREDYDRMFRRLLAESAAPVR